MQKSQKQATRGQRQIYDENVSTCKKYAFASLVSFALTCIFNLWFVPDNNGPWV